MSCIARNNIVKDFWIFLMLSFILRLTEVQIKDFRIFFLVTIGFSLIKRNSIIKDIWIYLNVGLCPQKYIKADLGFQDFIPCYFYFLFHEVHCLKQVF